MASWLYKPGDVVRIRDDLEVGELYHMLSGPRKGCTIHPSYCMLQLRGKTVTIKKHTSVGRYWINEDYPSHNYWADEMFELVEGECVCQSLL